jgi:hypothetical protein
VTTDLTEHLPAELAALVADLRSPDPEVRDTGAFTALATRIGPGFEDEHLPALGDAAVALLRDEQVQARSFGALLLAVVVDRDEVDAGTLRRWLGDFTRWYAGEADLRGYDDTVGWLHAVAHGADALGTFGGSPRLGPDDLGPLLQLAADRLLALTTYHLVHGEDDRLAIAVMTILVRGEVPTADVLAWLDRLATAWLEPGPAPAPAQVDNTVRFARTLHLQLTLGVHTGPDGPDEPLRHPVDRDELLHRLGSLLADGNPLYGSPA